MFIDTLILFSSNDTFVSKSSSSFSLPFHSAWYIKGLARLYMYPATVRVPEIKANVLFPGLLLLGTVAAKSKNEV